MSSVVVVVEQPDLVQRGQVLFAFYFRVKGTGNVFLPKKY